MHHHAVHVKTCKFKRLSLHRKIASQRALQTPSTSKAPQPMEAIQGEREETCNPVVPYPTLADAKVGQVLDL